MNRVLIFTEAGKGIGFGHLMRCKAIAEYLMEVGEAVNLYVFINGLILDDQDINVCNWHNQEPSDLISTNDIVLVDSYLVANNWLASAHKIAKKLVQIDDFNRTVYPVDLIINPNIFAGELDYSAQTAQCLGGFDYVILRKSFRQHKISHVPKKKVSVLITVGGSDYRGLLPKLTRWSLEAGDFEVKVIVPEDTLNIPEKATTLPLLNEEEMAKEITYADVVISACGQTLHELAALRKAVIGIGLDVDQEPNHKFYNEVGFINDQLWWDQPDLETKVKAQISHLSDASAREDRVNQSPPINVHGVEKVASAIIK